MCQAKFKLNMRILARVFMGRGEGGGGHMRNFTGNYVSWLIDFWVDWCLANSTDPYQKLAEQFCGV